MTREEAANIIDGAEVMILNRDSNLFKEAINIALQFLLEHGFDEQEQHEPLTPEEESK